MALDAESVRKHFKKLGKLLKKFPNPPSPEDVHDVRTRSRRIEAIELQKALEAANALRVQYLSSNSRPRSKKKPSVEEIHPAVIKATSRLAS